MKTRQIIIMAASLLFAVVGLGFWIVPETVAQLFHIESVGVAGRSTLSGDLGGLFMGLALLGLWAVRSRAMAPLKAAALFLAAIILGRGYAVATTGWSNDTLPLLLVEVATLIALLITIRATEQGTPVLTRRRILLGIGAIALLGSVGALAIMTPAVDERLFAMGAARLTSTENTAVLRDDALRVAVCGSSAPLASDRAKACVAVFAAGKIYIVDVGPESVENLVVWNIPLKHIDGVLLTHFHSDHIGDLGELQLQTWVQGRPSQLEVYGGPGVEQVVDGFNLAYRLDQGYRTAHHGPTVTPADKWGMVAHTVQLDGPATPEKSRTAVVLDQDGLRITAIEVEHAPIEPAYAYRFDYKGRSVVITGDTKMHPPLAKAAAGADILVSEAIARSMIKSLQDGAEGSGRRNVATIMHDIQDYHISPEEAATIANQAGVKLLVYYHLLPAPDAPLMRRMFGRGVDAVRRGAWHIADDGSLYTLPIGSNEVVIGAMTE